MCRHGDRVYKDEGGTRNVFIQRHHLSSPSPVRLSLLVLFFDSTQLVCSFAIYLSIPPTWNFFFFTSTFYSLPTYSSLPRFYTASLWILRYLLYIYFYTYFPFLFFYLPTLIRVSTLLYQSFFFYSTVYIYISSFLSGKRGENIEILHMEVRISPAHIDVMPDLRYSKRRRSYAKY